MCPFKVPALAAQKKKNGKIRKILIPVLSGWATTVTPCITDTNLIAPGVGVWQASRRPGVTQWSGRQAVDLVPHNEVTGTGRDG